MIDSKLFLANPLHGGCCIVINEKIVYYNILTVVVTALSTITTPIWDESLLDHLDPA